MASQNDVPLQLINNAASTEYEHAAEDLRVRGHGHAEPQEQVTLPPADGGLQAWAFLTAAFFIEALIWGFPFSFGLFQQYYESHPPFADAPSGITIIGTSAAGIMYLSAPLLAVLLQTMPHQRRLCTVIGFVINAVALVASSFATKVWQLILTQGVLYGIGGSLLYFPTIMFLDEWFIRRKGFAYGIMWAGTGASGVCVPFVMNWGLNKYGYSTMLRIWAIVLFVLSGPLLYFLKPRIPVARATYRRPPLLFGFLKTKIFWALQIGNILQGVGFFIPNIYLPTYAASLGLSKVAGATTIFLYNSTSLFAAIIAGALTDRLDATSVILICGMGACVSCLLLWGLATSFPLLCIFSLLYGMTAGGYSSVYPGMTKEVRKVDDRFDANFIFSLWAAGRGIGSVVSGPLSEALVSRKPWEGDAALGYGSGYGPLIVFTGVTAALGSTGWLLRRVGWV